MQGSTRYELRPRSFGEILDGAFQLYRDNFKTFFLIACVILPPTMALLVVQSQAMRELVGQSPGSILAVYERHFPWFILATVATGFLAIFESAALTVAIANAYLGHEVTVLGSFKRAFSNAGPVVGGAIIVGLGSMLGFMLCLVPGFIFWLNRVLYVPAIMVEGKDSGEAFARSKFLVSGQRQRIGLMLVLFGVIQFLLASGVGAVIPESVKDIPLLGPALVQIPQVVISPLFPAVTTLFYFDGRVRKEAFDLEVLSREIFKDASSSVGSAA